MKELNANGLYLSIAQALQKMEEEQGNSFSLEQVNLAELERLTGISRGKLRRLKKNGFQEVAHANKGVKHQKTKLSGYTGIIDHLLKQGIKNSAVCMQHLQRAGYDGGTTIVKEYISAHTYLIPAKRQLVEPQGNRGRRYHTAPGESYQMDWGFTDVDTQYGYTFRVACFAMICHHCGECYIEFFPNAKQENLFIGMIHAFQYMGVPKTVLTDNMKSVVIKRDAAGHPIWQKDYESFMHDVGFQTKLCKPRHPFTKGKVERLIRFVKDNFLAGRTFYNVTDLNAQALEWCNLQNSIYHRHLDGIPQKLHEQDCATVSNELPNSLPIRMYLAPERKISFDGFVHYEGRRYGVPYHYANSLARVMRIGDMLYIYSADLTQILTIHHVTWSYNDSYCENQYEITSQPEELPTTAIRTQLRQLPAYDDTLSFSKFDFDKERDE